MKLLIVLLLLSSNVAAARGMLSVREALRGLVGSAASSYAPVQKLALSGALLLGCLATSSGCVSVGIGNMYAPTSQMSQQELDELHRQNTADARREVEAHAAVDYDSYGIAVDAHSVMVVYYNSWEDIVDPEYFDVTGNASESLDVYTYRFDDPSLRNSMSSSTSEDLYYTFVYYDSSGNKPEIPIW